MPLPRKWNKRKNPPAGFDYVEPILEALENELRDKVKESNLNKRKTESVWPVHQINWQKSRYIYDMYYTHKKISRKVYEYCIAQNLIDAPLIAKWKKPGYERLCSTYVINSTNFKFGTTSICRGKLGKKAFKVLLLTYGQTHHYVNSSSMGPKRRPKNGARPYSEFFVAFCGKIL